MSMNELNELNECFFYGRLEAAIGSSFGPSHLAKASMAIVAVRQHAGIAGHPRFVAAQRQLGFCLFNWGVTLLLPWLFHHHLSSWLFHPSPQLLEQYDQALQSYHLQNVCQWQFVTSCGKFCKSKNSYPCRRLQFCRSLVVCSEVCPVC